LPLTFGDDSTDENKGNGDERDDSNRIDLNGVMNIHQNNMPSESNEQFSLLMNQAIQYNFSEAIVLFISSPILEQLNCFQRELMNNNEKKGKGKKCNIVENRKKLISSSSKQSLYDPSLTLIDESPCLSSLLLGFLVFYGYAIDYSEVGIQFEYDFSQLNFIPISHRGFSKGLMIMNPMQPTVDVGSNSRRYVAVVSYFRQLVSQFPPIILSK